MQGKKSGPPFLKYSNPCKIFKKSVSFAPEKSTIKKKAVVFSSLRLDID